LQVFGDQEYPEETRLPLSATSICVVGQDANNMGCWRSDVVSSIRKTHVGTGNSKRIPDARSSLPVVRPKARADFLVPSRLQPRVNFYALSNSPASSVKTAVDGLRALNK